MTSEEERAELLDLAIGTLQEWMNDYTPPLADGAQRRIRIVDAHDDGLTIRADPMGTYGNGPKYRVRIALEAIE